jgi:co-chaperonin GroES (HSP10)
MHAPIDNYLIELDSLYENNLIVGGGQFFDSSISLDDKDVLYNPNKYKKTNATIVGVPNRLSARSTDFKVSKIFNEGDTIHFYWTALNKDRFIEVERKYGETDKNGNVKTTFRYFLPAHRAICVTRGNEILMNADFVLLLPVMQEENEFKTSSGIFLQSEPKAKPNMGIIVHSNGFYQGKQVYYTTHSNSPIKINDIEYWAMNESDIFAVNENDEMCLIGEHLLVKPIDAKDQTDNGIIIPIESRQFTHQGFVVQKGYDCDDIEIGDKIMLSQQICVIEKNGEELLVVKKSDVICVLK